jgi:hypothetical protein
MVNPMNLLDVSARVCATAPLLFIAVLMAIDPEGFAKILQSVPFALRDFEQRIRGHPPQEFEPTEPVSARVPALIRLTGACLGVAAVLPLVPLAI